MGESTTITMARRRARGRVGSSAACSEKSVREPALVSESAAMPWQPKTAALSEAHRHLLAGDPRTAEEAYARALTEAGDPFVERTA